jgi:hypothetical protein
MDIGGHWAPSSPWVSSKKSIPSQSTKWCGMNLSSNHNLNSFHVRVSSRSNVSYFWNIHHSHACSFNRVWMKRIHSLLVLRRVSMYVYTWCNHSCNRLVFVYFCTKETGNLALLVTLAQPPLGALLMAPKPSSMWFINLVVAWLCAMASPYWTTNTQKMSTKAKNFLDNFSTFGVSCFCFSRDSSTLGHSKAYLPPFLLFGPLKGKIKECTSPLDS